MSSIDNLKAIVSQKNGLARGNRFNVIFTPPSQSLLNLNPDVLIGSLLSGSFNAKNLISDPRDISLLCQSASLPGRQVTTLDYQAEKQTVPVPYAFIDEDVTCKFLLTNDYYMKIIFDDWLSAILDLDTYEVGYKKDFATDVVVQQLDLENKPVYGVRLVNAFPTSVTGVELDSASTEVQELNVVFSYDKYIPEGPTSTRLSGVSNILDALT